MMCSLIWRADGFWWGQYFIEHRLFVLENRPFVVPADFLFLFISADVVCLFLHRLQLNLKTLWDNRYIVFQKLFSIQWLEKMLQLIQCWRKKKVETNSKLSNRWWSGRKANFGDEDDEVMRRDEERSLSVGPFIQIHYNWWKPLMP